MPVHTPVFLFAEGRGGCLVFYFFTLSLIPLRWPSTEPETRLGLISSDPPVYAHRSTRVTYLNVAKPSLSLLIGLFETEAHCVALNGLKFTL